MNFWGSCPQSYVHLRFRFWGHSWEWGGPGALGGPGNAITFSRSIHQVATGAKGSRPHITLERLFAQSVQCAAVCVFAEIPQKIWGQNVAALRRQRKMLITVKKVCYKIWHSEIGTNTQHSMLEFQCGFFVRFEHKLYSQGSITTKSCLIRPSS